MCLGDLEAAEKRAAAEVVLAGTLLAVVEVGVAALRAKDPAALRQLHALRRALLRLHLRHFSSSFRFLAGRAALKKPDPDGFELRSIHF